MSEYKELLACSKIFGSGRTQIPSEIRHFLELKDGDKIYYFRDLEDRIFIEKAPKVERRKGKY